MSRTTGASGRVQVYYQVTNTFYTDIYETNIYGTNLYITNFASNGTTVLNFTNIFITNYYTHNQMENYTTTGGVGYFYCEQDSGVELAPGLQFGVTNANGIISSGGGATVVNAPVPCANFSGSNLVTNSDGTQTMTVSNIFCIEVVTNNQDPSAEAGVDYEPTSGILTFNDYQMGADIPMDILGNEGMRNRLLVVTLTNAALDPLESTSLAPPTIDPVGGSALVVLRAVTAQGGNPLTSVGWSGPCFAESPTAAAGTNSIVNFETSVFQLSDQSVTWAIFDIIRTGTNLAAGCSVNYTVGGNPAVPISTANTFALRPASDYANPNPPDPDIASSQPPDFGTTTGTVTWGANDTTVKSFSFPIIYNSAVKFNEDLNVTLSNPQSCVLGQVTSCTVTILFDNQPAGAIDRNHNPNNVSTTDPPYNNEPGANGTVYSAVIQPDNKTVFVGDFNAYDTVPRNCVERMNADGSLDTGFLASPNSGIDNADGGVVTCVALSTNGNIYIGGDFTSFNGTTRYSIARLTANGSLDTNFNPGIGVTTQIAPNVPGTVSAMLLQPDGKVIIAGEFTAVNATNRNNIARLNPDGSLDTSFDPGIGPNNIINAMALQSGGQIVIGGDFTALDGSNYSYVARLNADGSLDTSFSTGLGPDRFVNAVAIQPNGQILIGGAFDTINLISSHSIARLNTDGSLDTSFSTGSGADNAVDAITLQTDGKILIGGEFDSFNGTRRIGLARLLTYGVLDTSFMDTAYDQFAGPVRDYFNQAVDPLNFIYSIAEQADSNIIVAGSFYQWGGGYATDQGTYVFARDGLTPRLNIARLIGGSTPGPGNVGLAYTSYTADKLGGSSYVTLVRNNGALGPASVTFTPMPQTAGPGVAVSGTDFTQTTYHPYWSTTWPGAAPIVGDPSWDYADSYTGPNNAAFDDLTPPMIAPYDIGTADVYLNVLNNPNSTVNLALDVGVSAPQSSDIFFLGGENIPLGVALDRTTSAPMTIVDNTLKNGVLGFSSPTYSVSEGSNSAVITITRTNGSTGSATVYYSTTGGGTAVAGPANNYGAVSNTLPFITGQTSNTFSIPIYDNGLYAPDKTVDMVLLNPTGGATLGQSTAQLTIINNNFPPGHVNFIATNFSAEETAGTATISVSRTGGSSGTLSVNYFSTDGTATNGLNYGAVSNTLNWNSGDVTVKTFTVPLIHDGLVTSNLTANLHLTDAVAVVNGVITSNVANALGLVTNATLTIVNEDFFGRPTFSTPTYSVNNNGGFVTITVNRLGGSAQTITVNYTTVDGTNATPAFAGIDYTAVSGTLTFPPGVFSQSFTVPITAKSTPVGNLTFGVALSNPTPTSGPGGGVTLGNPSAATVTIIDPLTLNDPPGGVDPLFGGASFNGPVYTLALQTNGQILAGGDFTFADGTPRNSIARLNSDGSIDPKFSSPTAGVDASVRTLAVQTDGAILIGGLFQHIDGVNRQYIGRLQYDGAVDETFNPGSGADNPVYALAETFAGPPTNAANRRILIGGSFASVNGVSLNDIAQLNDDGSIDGSFDPAGANGTVYAIAVYSTNDTVNGGRILIGGDFTQVDGVTRNHIARLNADGTLDTTFNPGAGPNDSVRAIAIQVDGGVLIGGLFTSVGSAGLNHIARLNPNGQVDALFNPGTGANDAVTCVTLQQDHRIVVGGDFTLCNGVTRNRLTRLNSDGSVDPSINFGTGADNFVSAIVIQPNAEIVIGGAFTEFNGVSAPSIARLFGLNNAGSGSLQFVSANFSVVENITNIVIGVQRVGGTAGTASVLFSTSDGTAVSGSNYLGATNTLVFPTGETLQSVSIPIISNNIVDINRTVNLALSNPTGAVLGGQPTALLTIINDNSGVNFSSPTYTVIKNAVNGAAVITVQRIGSSIGPASVELTTTTNGTATPVLDYTPTTNIVYFEDGQTNQTATVPVNNNGLIEGNRTVGLMLSNPTNTILLSPTTATLTIIDNNNPPGDFMFSSPTYSASEKGTNVAITVLRTNGSTGSVSVHVATSDGTAVAGVNYVSTSTNLAFADGVTSQSFLVPVTYDPAVQGNLTVNLTLSNPSTNTLILGPNPATLTIMDADTGVGFVQPVYFATDTNGILTLGVQRLGNTNGVFSVNYATTNGTATAGTDYVATNGMLNFASGETFETLNLFILNNSAFSNRIFLVNLSNPSSPVQLVTNSTASITVVATNIGLEFSSTNNGVDKSGGNVTVSVLRVGSPSGPVSVGFATQDGTALAGTNYDQTSGTLAFADGQISNSYTVTIINDERVDPNLTFTNLLLNPIGAQLLFPSNQTVTITNDLAGFSFSSPAYSVSENGVSAVITVLRTGFTNNVTNTLSVSYATANGTAIAGTQYLATNGTLAFTNGQASATITVPIIDRNVTGGSETVLLTLSNPSTGAILVNPNAATLTILNNDLSLIVPAGTVLTGGSGPLNGAINPGETVTNLFALRNVAGTNTGNLVATLLATNGVTSPSGQQSYGVLVTNGPSVSRSFSFKANGTNGSQILATLQLQDGATSLGTAIFTFTLGTANNSFTNNSLIIINDNSTATPYPSVLNVSGVAGTVSKVTATVSNLSHGSISDVGMLLAGPTGTNTLLMGNVGSGDVSDVDLTFDDSGAAFTDNPPASGTYRPTQFVTFVPFPVSTNGPALLPKPFGTTLSVFTNTNPNGTWLLYVIDDVPLDGGTIANGWSLNITTLGVIAPTINLVAGVTASTNSVVVSSNLTYTITVSNAGPSTATGVTLTDVLPSGVTLVSSNASPGSWSSNLVCDIGTLVMNATATATLVVSDSTPGLVTNSVTAAADESDANPALNTASVVTAVVTPSADVAVGLADAPNPVLTGNHLTYTISVTNFGPATATGVTVTDTLPAGVTFVSNSPPGIATNSAGTVIGNLGTIGSGGVVMFNIVVMPTVGGTNTDTVNLGDNVAFPFKADRTASVKTVVIAVQLGIAKSGNSLTFSWPTNASAYTLQFATNLNSPVTWTSVTSPAPQLVGGQYTVTLTNSGTTRYFRLNGPGP